MTIKDIVWTLGVILALGVTWGMTSQRVSAMEKDVDRLEKSLQLVGYPCLFVLNCRNSEGEIDDSFRTLMLQEMIARGILFQGLFFPTWSHKQKEVDQIIKAFDKSCAVYCKAIATGSTNNFLIGRATKPVFRKKI